jgi:predicted nucleic-acid-binding protein
MIAVGTNLLVRLLTNDDPTQARRALKILNGNDIYIPKTVPLKMEWVLRHADKIERSNITYGFQKLLGLPNVSVEDPDSMYQAINWYEDNFEFADALHYLHKFLPLITQEFMCFTRKVAVMYLVLL